jgi:hypothetical protein
MDQAYQYVLDVSVSNAPGSPQYTDPDFGGSGATYTAAENTGESGCYGWPSDVGGGTVSGEGMTLIDSYPYVLTQQLHTTFSFILSEVNQDTADLPYIIADAQLARDLGEENRISTVPELLQEINREHISMEASWKLMGDARRSMANLVRPLHHRSRDLAGLAVDLDASLDGTDATNAFDEGPSLRKFARKFSRFLSRMCTNRGCSDRLLRTAELSFRHECFTSFLMDRYFTNNPGTTTLPSCRAQIIP